MRPTHITLKKSENIYILSNIYGIKMLRIKTANFNEIYVLLAFLKDFRSV